MISIDLYDLDGKQSGKADLPDEYFAGKIVKHLLHDVVRAEEAAGRQGNAKTKCRGEVRGGGKKPHKQKGTGRARAGSTRSPLWRSGGITFGPQPRQYKVKVNKKERRIALTSALTARAQEERIVGLNSYTLDAPKTQTMAAFLSNFSGSKKPLLVYTNEDQNLVKSTTNIKNAKIASWNAISTRSVLVADLLILTPSAIAAINAFSENTAADQSTDAQPVVENGGGEA